MAFNPFTSFRKHQKVWMATILIVCMMTFVLCTGLSGGDLGSWLLNMFGGGRGGTIARYDGKTISDRELSNLRVQRKLANEFMIMAAQRGRELALDDVIRNVEDPTAQRILFDLASRSLGMGEMGPLVFDMQLNQLTGNAFGQQGEMIRKVRPILAKWGPKLKPILEQAGPVARYEKAGQYFAGSDSDEDLFTFILWRDEAKSQGIAEIDEQGARQEVRLATHPRFSQDDWKKIETSLRRSKNSSVNADTIMSALLDEFRVRQCQTDVLGYRPGPGIKPEVVVTPDQAWEYYKAKRSEFNVEVLPIPVEPFLSQVKKEPTDEELKTFFNKYRSLEKDPASPKPGFKRMRRVKAAWITGDPASPYYKGMSTFVLEAARARFSVGWKLRIMKKYGTEMFNYKLPAWTEGNFVLPFYQTGEEPEVEKAQKEAALIAQTVGLGVTWQALGTGPQSWLASLPVAVSLPVAYQAPALVRAVQSEMVKRAAVAATAALTGADPLTASGLSNYAARPDYYLPLEKERARRTAVAATLALSGISSSPVFPGNPGVLPYAGLLHYSSPNTSNVQHIPLELVQDQIVKKFQEDEATRLLNENVLAVKKEIDRYKPGEKDLPIRARKVTEKIEEAAKKYHLTLGATSRPHDKFTIGDDPALKPLKEASAGRGTFNDLFFPSTGTSELYVPKALGQISAESTDQPYLYWTTEDQDARVLDTFESIRDEVVKQWKHAKARILAQTRAEEVVKAIAKAGDDVKRAELMEQQEKALRKDKILKDEQRTIPLFDVAPLISQRTTQPDMFNRGAPRATAYKVPTASFSYPRTDEWSKKLLAMGGGGEKVQILENAPETIFYVAVRVRAPEARKSAFLDSNRNKDDIWARWNRKFAKDLFARKVEELKTRKKFEDLRSETAKTQAKEKKETPLAAATEEDD